MASRHKPDTASKTPNTATPTASGRLPDKLPNLRHQPDYEMAAKAQEPSVQAAPSTEKHERFKDDRDVAETGDKSLSEECTKEANTLREQREAAASAPSHPYSSPSIPPLHPSRSSAPPRVWYEAPNNSSYQPDPDPAKTARARELFLQRTHLALRHQRFKDDRGPTCIAEIEDDSLWEDCTQEETIAGVLGEQTEREAAAPAPGYPYSSPYSSPSVPPVHPPQNTSKEANTREQKEATASAPSYPYSSSSIPPLPSSRSSAPPHPPQRRLTWYRETPYNSSYQPDPAKTARARELFLQASHLALRHQRFKDDRGPTCIAEIEDDSLWEDCTQEETIAGVLSEQSDREAATPAPGYPYSSPYSSPSVPPVHPPHTSAPLFPTGAQTHVASYSGKYQPDLAVQAEAQKIFVDLAEHGQRFRRFKDDRGPVSVADYEDVRLWEECTKEECIDNIIRNANGSGTSIDSTAEHSLDG